MSTDALSSILRDVPETAIGDNPYVAMAKAFAAAQQNVAAPRNNFESFLVPLVQQGALGVMQGLAAKREENNLFDYYKQNPLIQALASSAPKAETIGPVLDGAEYSKLLAAAPLAAYQQSEAPPNWTPEQGKGDLFKALIGYQAQQEQTKAANELETFKQKEQAKQDIKTQAEAAKPAKDWSENIGEQVKTQTGQAYAMLSSLESVAKKISALPYNAAEWQAGTLNPKDPAFFASRDLQALVSPIVRSLGEVGALSEPEQARALGIIQGNIIAGPKEISELLLQLRSRIGQMSRDRLTAVKLATQLGGDALLDKFAKAAVAPTSKPNPLQFSSGPEYKAAMEAWRASGGS